MVIHIFIPLELKIRYGKYKLEPLEKTCYQAQDLLRKIKVLATIPAEVAHFDHEFKNLIKLFERTETP